MGARDSGGEYSPGLTRYCASSPAPLIFFCHLIRSCFTHLLDCPLLEHLAALSGPDQGLAVLGQ